MDRQPIYIDLFNKMSESVLRKEKRDVQAENYPIYCIKNVVFHRRQVERFQGQFCARFYAYSCMDLIFVVILNAENQTEIAAVIIAVFLKQMD